MKVFDKLTLAVAATMLAEAFVGTLFRFYYIKVFLEVYGLTTIWLNVTQILFMIWNALNDPLMGCVQDVGCGKRGKWLMDRRLVILYMGPLFSLSFLLFWFPWTLTTPEWVVGCHLLLALFIYDTLYSLVFSAHCGLFTELDVSHFSRVRVVIYMEVAIVIGTLSVYPVDKLSKNLQDFAVFQYFCVGAAVLSALCFLYTGIFGPREVAQVKNLMEMQSTAENEAVAKAENMQHSLWSGCLTGLSSSWQVLKERDFLCVVCANFFRLMRITVATNFTAIFVEALIAPNGLLPFGSVQLSVFYQVAQTLPSILFILLWPVLHRTGPWIVNMGLVGLSVINCLVMLLVGRHNYVCLAVYIMLENVFSRTGYPGLYFIFLPDVVDEDMKRHKRPSPISTLIFTLNALVTKPASSVAPMVVVGFLSTANYGLYNRLKQSTRVDSNSTLLWENNVRNETSKVMTDVWTSEDEDRLMETMWLVACLFPLFCVIVETLLLLPYRLKFYHRRDAVAAQ